MSFNDTIEDMPTNVTGTAYPQFREVDSRKKLLLSRCKEEYNQFIAEQINNAPSSVIANAAKIAGYNKILAQIESGMLELCEIDALLTLELPMTTIYAELLECYGADADQDCHDVIIETALTRAWDIGASLYLDGEHENKYIGEFRERYGEQEHPDSSELHESDKADGIFDLDSMTAKVVCGLACAFIEVS